MKSWHDGLRAVDELSRADERHDVPQVDAGAAHRRRDEDGVEEDETPGSRRRRRANPNTSIGGFYRQLKGATVRAYYTSSIGIHDDQHYKGNVYQQGDYAGFDPT